MAITTIPDKATGDTFTEAMWDDYIKTNINEITGRAAGNLLTNGNFQVWQRGAGAFASNNFWSADRWYHQRVGGAGTSSQSVTQETSITNASLSTLKSVVTSYVSVGTEVVQKVENFAELRNRTISLSIHVNQGVASAVTPFIRDSTATTSGATSATTGSFIELTVSRTISGSATSVEAGVVLAANGTFYLSSAMLVVGPTPTIYVPTHPQWELACCQRYYEILSADYVTVASAGSQNLGYGLNYKQDKGGTPTVTKNGTWSVTNCGQPTLAQRTGQEGRMVTAFAASSAGGVMQFTANSSDDTITSEWNP